MDALSQLGLLASIAATYSGFIAVFTVLARDGKFEKADGHFVQAMVLGTIGVITMALMPPILALMMPRAQVWWVATLVGIIGGVPSLAYQIWQQVTMPEDEKRKIPAGWHIPGWGLGLLALVAFFAAAAYPELREGLYVAAVTLMLATAIWCFIAIVFRKFF
jgi:hypothetical protein